MSREDRSVGDSASKGVGLSSEQQTDEQEQNGSRQQDTGETEGSESHQTPIKSPRRSLFSPGGDDDQFSGDSPYDSVTKPSTVASSPFSTDLGYTQGDADIKTEEEKKAYYIKHDSVISEFKKEYETDKKHISKSWMRANITAFSTDLNEIKPLIYIQGLNLSVEESVREIKLKQVVGFLKELLSDLSQKDLFVKDVICDTGLGIYRRNYQTAKFILTSCAQLVSWFFVYKFGYRSTEEAKPLNDLHLEEQGVEKSEIMLKWLKELVVSLDSLRLKPCDGYPNMYEKFLAEFVLCLRKSTLVSGENKVFFLKIAHRLLSPVSSSNWADQVWSRISGDKEDAFSRAKRYILIGNNNHQILDSCRKSTTSSTMRKKIFPDGTPMETPSKYFNKEKKRKTEELKQELDVATTIVETQRSALEIHSQVSQEERARHKKVEEELESVRGELTKTLESKKEDLQSKEEEIERLSKLQQSHVVVKAASDVSAASAKTRAEKLEAKVSDLKNELKTSQAENAKLKAENVQLDNNLEIVRGEFAKKKEECEELKEESEELKEESETRLLGNKILGGTLGLTLAFGAYKLLRGWLSSGSEAAETTTPSGPSL